MVTTKLRADAFHALAVYAESLADGRRAIVFGDPVEGLAERLVELGARSVVQVTPVDDAGQRNRTFDLALVTGPTSFEDPAALLSRVRRALTEDGVAVIAGVALDYYRLFDLAAAEFEDVRMVGLLPFEGVALVELGGEESPAVSVDTQLAEPDRSPELFVAVASRRRQAIDPYAIVELPSSPQPQEPREDQALVAALAQERLRAQALEAQLQDAVRQAHVVDDLSAALAHDGLRVAELEAALEEERTEAEEGRLAVAQLEEAGNQLEQARLLAAASQAEMARTAQTHVAELARFEETLRERAQNIRVLEAEVARRDRMVRELVDSLEALPREQPVDERSSDPTPLTDELARENSILRWRLDALALELARRDAEMQAGEWAIQELQHELAREEQNARPEHTQEQALGPAGPTQGDTQRLAAALEELEALRLALTQEHQARVRAESGEELVRARSEIQRQAALVEQLGRELQATRPPREELR
jgi:hypothetical protein